jgi:hypothetical protein
MSRKRCKLHFHNTEIPFATHLEQAEHQPVSQPHGIVIRAGGFDGLDGSVHREQKAHQVTVGAATEHKCKLMSAVVRKGYNPRALTLSTIRPSKGSRLREEAQEPPQ